MGWIPQIGRNCLPIPVRGGIKARTERYADRERIIRATAARDEARHIISCILYKMLFLEKNLKYVK